MSPALSASLRVAGAAVALIYLLGVVSGPLVVPVVAFGVVTAGRMLRWGPAESLVAGAALAVLAVAVGVPALRWSTLDLGELRGVQAVLGPTVLVAPAAAAAAAWTGATAGLVALGAWLGPPGAPEERSTPAIAWWGFEAALGALALVTVFWGPAVRGWGTGTTRVAGALSWLVAVLVAGGCAAGLAWVRERVPAGALWGAVGVAGLASVAAALVAAIAP